ncbi:hypothetical protein NC652_041565 [Populus alba x Populus x berolinensis]|nr:hypothetical protein NC652_041547 [Populus alba x Populus x berolinensis]KAJ6859302.1 hypothetical protein NC652_041558 [Populus alba x Populus x berolinensis]KAJ6859309.1 hypothetical protein NC652_041565 [Populus alba x Populus x berolinensis]
MKKQVWSSVLLICLSFLLASSLSVEAQTCRPSDKIRGRKAPKGQCNEENDSLCCTKGRLYTTYKCSPPATNHTNFEKGGDGGAPSEYDNQHYSDDTPVVALST